MKPEEMDELQHRKAVCFKNPLFGAGTHNADGEFTFLSLHASLFAERSIAALGAHHVPVPIWYISEGSESQTALEFWIGQRPRIVLEYLE